MEVSVESTGGLNRRMTVKVPAERVEQEVESRLKSMSQTVRLAGFRPGKVPRKVIEQKYGKQVRHEVVDQVINSTLQDALSQEGLRPAGYPNIEPGEPQAGQPLEYVATFEVFPELTSDINYGFSVVRPIVEIVADDVQEMLENLRKQRATWNVVERAAITGDQVTIDFEGTVEGAAFAGNKAEKMPVVLGSGSMIPGFEEQLINVSAGEEKTIDITFPDDYPSTEVAGKASKFNVKVHSVSETVLPEIDEEFARAFGVAQGGVPALTTEIRNNMERELKGLVKSKMKSQVFEGLLQDNPVEVPESLVESEIKELQRQEGKQGLDVSTLRESAIKRLKLGVIVSEIAKRNQIHLDPDRVRELVETIASSYEKPEEVVQWYYGNQEMLSGVQSAVIEEQVVEWIVEHSGIDVQDEKTTFFALIEEAKQSQGQP
ncbi:MAG: trigger factor [Gammaproteobacteria bacterium]|jgi:trigger factor|nr:trigger factor [Gammaproteobacteria bacterium]